SRLSGYAGNGASTGLAIVPLADFRVIAASTASQAAVWSPLDVTQPVGITSLSFAWLAALVLIVVAWGGLYAFGRMRAVPGGSSPLLTVISTRNGYASLSQLQIILWSFVIGAGAVYVMTLSGNLIEIGSGPLVLLGISGIAAVGSKLQSTIAASPATPAAPAAPGHVVGLAPNGPAGETEVRLSWAAATDGGRPDTYTVEYRRSAVPPALPGLWLVATNTLARPGFRVVGLTAATPYDFQVYGVNAT